MRLPITDIELISIYKNRNQTAEAERADVSFLEKVILQQDSIGVPCDDPLRHETGFLVVSRLEHVAIVIAYDITMHLDGEPIDIVTVTPMGKGISAPEFEALSFSSEVQDLEDAKKVLEEIRQISLQGVVYNAGVIAKQTTTNHTSYLNRLLKILITGRHG